MCFVPDCIFEALEELFLFFAITLLLQVIPNKHSEFKLFSKSLKAAEVFDGLLEVSAECSLLS